jgi:hypothetical protein
MNLMKYPTTFPAFSTPFATPFATRAATAVATTLATALALSVALPASAALAASTAAPGVWATWTGATDAAESSFAFVGTVYGGTVAMTKTDNSNLLSTNGVYAVDGGSYFTAATPIGQVFGPNGPAGSNAYRDRVGGAITGSISPSSVRDVSPLGLAELGATSTTVFTFATPVPAGALGIGIQDFDEDQATISATDAAGNPVSGSDIIGDVGGVLAFNECSFTPQPTDCVDGLGPYTASPMAFLADTSVWVIHPFAGPAEVGSNVWLRPAVAIKTLTIVHTSDGDDDSSAIDVSLAMVTAAPGGSEAASAPVLAATGTDAAPLTVVGAVLALLGAGVVATRVISRRRESAV